MTIASGSLGTKDDSANMEFVVRKKKKEEGRMLTMRLLLKYT
jgi:hypothetical protein